MTKTTTTLLASLLLAGLAACEGHAGRPAVAPEKGFASGRVVDTRGQPIAGAKVLLENRIFYASYIDGSTDQDGRYRLRVHPGAWKAQASFRKSYNGRTYVVELAPDSSDSLDQDGGVRNFTWKLEGRTPGSDDDYYGGHIQLNAAIGFYEDMEAVELVLVPQGPLIDGSQGKTLRLRLGDHYWVDRYQIEDIPIGRYLVTATLHGDDGPRPLKIQDWRTRSDFTPEFQLDFQPRSDSAIRISASIAIGEGE